MSRWEGEVPVVIEGREYTGHYRVDDKGMLHVSCGGDTESTHHRRPQDPKSMAEILLRKLVAKAKKDGAA